MNAEAFRSLGLAILTVDHETINSGRPRARVMRMLANNETQRNKAVSRTIRTAIHFEQKHRAETEARVMQQRNAELAQSIAEANAKAVK